MSGDTFGKRSTDNLEYLRVIEKRLAKVEDENAGLRCSVRDLLMDKANLGYRINALNKTIARLRLIADLPDEDDNGPTN